VQQCPLNQIINLIHILLCFVSVYLEFVFAPLQAPKPILEHFGKRALRSDDEVMELPVGNVLVAGDRILNHIVQNVIRYLAEPRQRLEGCRWLVNEWHQREDCSVGRPRKLFGDGDLHVILFGLSQVPGSVVEPVLGWPLSFLWLL